MNRRTWFGGVAAFCAGLLGRKPNTQWTDGVPSGPWTKSYEDMSAQDIIDLHKDMPPFELTDGRTMAIVSDIEVDPEGNLRFLSSKCKVVMCEKGEWSV